jgi:MFS transporter, DHA1 family, multidrug resistance protein
VLALDVHGAIAGTASALMGTLQFVTGAVVMGLTGLFLDGTARPMLAGIAGSGVMALLLASLTLSKHREVVEVSRG